MENTGVIILAAGSSSRLGQPKQLLEFHGKTLLKHVMDIAGSFDFNEKIVVLGAYANKIRQNIDMSGFTTVFNDQWEEGIASSIRIGLAKLLESHPGLDRVLFLLSDQPYVTHEFLQKIIDEDRSQEKTITASQYDKTLGVPAIFSKELFQDLLKMKGDRGASAIMRKYPEKITAVPFDQGGFDVDTKEDLDQLPYMYKENG